MSIIVYHWLFLSISIAVVQHLAHQPVRQIRVLRLSVCHDGSVAESALGVPGEGKKEKKKTNTKP